MASLGDVLKDMEIVPLLPEHWSALRTIYEQGIATGHATFQTDVHEWEE